MHAIATQQGYMLAHTVRRVPRRIVSLHKPYVRPIIRGKENKPYEFGAKAHVMQVGGLNFIELLSFEAFHEGNRIWQSIARNQKRFGKRCAQYGGYRIYSNNANRTKTNKRSLQTCFPPKGRRVKDEAQRKQARAAIANARATRLEGSPGTEKEHYGLRKVKARTELTKIAWIFLACMPQMLCACPRGLPKMLGRLEREPLKVPPLHYDDLRLQQALQNINQRLN